jgi:hypothetical protein
MSPDPRYPIGEYEPKPFSIEQKIEWLADLKFLPLLLENAILNLDEAQLHTLIVKEAGRFTRWCIMWPTAISMPIAGSS